MLRPLFLSLALALLGRNSSAGDLSVVGLNKSISDSQYIINKILTNETNCPPELSSDEVDLCAADPFEKICNPRDPEIAAIMLDLQDKSYSKKGKKEFEEDIRKHASSDRARATKKLIEARDVMIKAMEKSTFDGKTKSALQEYLSTCISKKGRQEEFTESSSASVQGAVFPKAQFQISDGLMRLANTPIGGRINPLKSSTGVCQVFFSPGLHLACRQDSFKCMQIIFHELSHFLNSCSFWHLENKTRAVSTRDHDEYKFLSVLRKSALTIREQLSTNVECLKSLVGTKDAVLLDDSVPNADYLRRCGEHKYNSEVDPRYPAEWKESEADLWASSFMADWLESQVSDVKKRKELVIKFGKRECAQHLFIKKHSGQKVMEAIGDPHDDTHERFNALLLKNSEFRRVLGCTLNVEVPLSCSPLGRTHRRIIPLTPKTSGRVLSVGMEIHP